MLVTLGRHPGTIDLLPGGKHLPSVDGAVKLDGVVEFDGRTVAVEVPVETFNGRLESRFTMSTWLKHKRQSTEEEEVKQHILCSADGEGTVGFNIMIQCTVVTAGVHLSNSPDYEVLYKYSVTLLYIVMIVLLQLLCSSFLFS